MVAALGAGLAGWLLLLSGAGKLTLWPDFRRGLLEGGTLPGWLAVGAGWGAPWAELCVGLAVLVRPSWPSLGAAAALFALFAVYQASTLRAGRSADCHCYGKLRQMRSGAPAAVGNGALTLLALAVPAVAAASGSGVLARLLGGLVLAVAYMATMGTSAKGRTRFVFAEVRYLQERAQGRGDREARAVVAKEFGLSAEASYLLLPRSRAAVILVRQRLGLKTTL